MSTQQIALTGLCNWSAEKRVNTRNGPRILQTAVPDETFWAVWRDEQQKAVLKSEGVSISKDYKTGDWQVCWWRQLPAEELEVMRKNVELSQQTTADITVPKPDNGMDYYPFQKAGIAFARGKSRRADRG